MKCNRNAYGLDTFVAPCVLVKKILKMCHQMWQTAHKKRQKKLLKVQPQQKQHSRLSRCRTYHLHAKCLAPYSLIEIHNANQNVVASDALYCGRPVSATTTKLKADGRSCRFEKSTSKHYPNYNDNRISDDHMYKWRQKKTIKRMRKCAATFLL